MAQDDFFEDGPSVFSSDSEDDIKELEDFLTDAPPVKKVDPKTVTPATDKDKQDDKDKGNKEKDVAEQIRLQKEQEKKEEEELLDELLDNKKPGTSEGAENKTDTTDKEEVELGDVQGIAQDFFNAGIWTRTKDEDGNEEELPETQEELIERGKWEITRTANQMVFNLLGAHGDEYREAFEAMLVNGVNPREYLTKFEEINDFKSMDLSSEYNQEKVVTAALKLNNWEEADIKDEIQKLKNNADLESTATRYHKGLVKREEAGLVKMQEESARKAEEKKQLAQLEATNIRNVLNEAAKKQDLDGVPVTREDIPKIVDFIEKKNWKMADGSLLTDQQCAILDLDRPDNHAEKVKLSAILMKAWDKTSHKIKLDFSSIEKKAVSKNEEKKFFQGYKGNNKKETVKQGKEEFSLTDFL